MARLESEVLENGSMGQFQVERFVTPGSPSIHGARHLSTAKEMVTYLRSFGVAAARIESGDEPMSIAEKAKQVYESDLKARLEAEHRDEFVAIEPVSKSYFLSNTFIDAALAAKRAYPDRKSFVIRIGHNAAFHIGAGAS